MEGTIVKVDTSRGFVFISRPGGNDIFAHASEFDDNVLPFDAQLQERRVRYDVGQDERGRDRAVNVRPAR